MMLRRLASYSRTVNGCSFGHCRGWHDLAVAASVVRICVVRKAVGLYWPLDLVCIVFRCCYEGGCCGPMLLGVGTAVCPSFCVLTRDSSVVLVRLIRTREDL